MRPRRGSARLEPSGKPVRSRLAGRALPVLVLLANGLVIGFFLAFPLVPEFDWHGANAHLLLITGLMAVAVFLHASVTLSPREAGVLFLLSATITTAAEWSGVHFGIPFGARYEYNVHLTPRIADAIPLFIPLAWFVLIYTPLVVFRPLFVASTPPGVAGLLLRVLICALYLASMDLYLDPLAVHVGAWQWQRAGGYFGVPVSNFLGWTLVGLAVYSSFVALGGLRAPRWVARTRFLDRLFVFASLPLVLAALALVAYHLRAWWPVLIVSLILVPTMAWWWHAQSRTALADEPSAGR